MLRDSLRGTKNLMYPYVISVTEGATRLYSGKKVEFSWELDEKLLFRKFFRVTTRIEEMQQNITKLVTALLQYGKDCTSLKIQVVQNRKSKLHDFTFDRSSKTKDGEQMVFLKTQ